MWREQAFNCRERTHRALLRYVLFALPRPMIVPCSIHALRKEGDSRRRRRPRPGTHFNPHPPCGGRPWRGGQRMRRNEFQSAPSLRRATVSRTAHRRRRQHFNPRPPCGGRHAGQRHKLLNLDISTRALLAEGDPARPRPLSGCGKHFNPRPPCGGRPQFCHKPSAVAVYFNPRPPCGGRLRALRRSPILWAFQPAPSLRRATVMLTIFGRLPGIFQPAPSLRRATNIFTLSIDMYLFQPAPSLRRATLVFHFPLATPTPFQPAPSLRRATEVVLRII